MAKSCGPLRKGRAVDGKLKSNLQWPKDEIVVCGCITK